MSHIWEIIIWVVYFITSEKGLTCQNWSWNRPHRPNPQILNGLYSQGDNLNDNFCRIADPSDPRPWCYTTDPNVRFDYCDCPGSPRSPSGPICLPDAGTITRPFSFEYAIYDSSASVVQHARSRSNRNGNRIFGGKDATPGEVPWQVNFFLDGTQLNNLMCGGTLVSSAVRYLPSEILTKMKSGTYL